MMMDTWLYKLRYSSLLTIELVAMCDVVDDNRDVL